MNQRAETAPITADLEKQAQPENPEQVLAQIEAHLAEGPGQKYDLKWEMELRGLLQTEGIEAAALKANRILLIERARDLLKAALQSSIATQRDFWIWPTGDLPQGA